MIDPSGRGRESQDSSVLGNRLTCLSIRQSVNGCNKLFISNKTLQITLRSDQSERDSSQARTDIHCPSLTRRDSI